VGQLSASILDTFNGRPAAGVAIDLHRLDGNGGRALLLKTATDASGRTNPPLLDAGTYRTGSYEVEFHLGAYFRAAGAPVAEPPFLDVITVRLQLAEADGDYRLPIIAAPWGYQLYRGS
jgi:5-hydroxyisourate hydrolase